MWVCVWSGKRKKQMDETSEYGYKSPTVIEALAIIYIYCKAHYL